MIFFIPSSAVGDELRLSDDDRSHLYAIRPNTGDLLTLSDGTGFLYESRIIKADKSGFLLKIEKKTPFFPLLYKTTMFLPLLKGDRAEYCIQKCTELGVSEIILFSSQNCVVTNKEGSGKTERYRKIAKMAAMQSLRNDIPRVCEAISFSEAVCELKARNGLFFYERATRLLSAYLKEDNIVPPRAFITGPEGGFTENEAAAMLSENIPSLSLGKRILRAETAPVCVLSVLMAFAGEI